MPLVLTQVTDRTGIVTLNHDAKRNALSRALIEELIAALDVVKAAEARSVVLRAHPGATVWSAGHDINELPERGRDPLAYNDPLRRAVRALESISVPVIAMIEGGVWGGACELAVTCDLIVAAPSATFALTPARLGVPYNTVGVLNLMRSISTPLLKEMLFTASPISAERALQVGMINALVPAAELERATFEMATRIAEMSPMSVAVSKEELRILSESRPMSPETFERLQSLRTRVYDSHDYQEGLTAFRERRKPVFTGE